LFDYLLCADIGLMLYQPGIRNHVYAFPMKMYDYMLAGLPIVGPKFAVEVVPVVNELACGLLVDTSRPEEIAQALDELCGNPNLAREMGRRGLEGVIRRYNWEIEADKLTSVYSAFAKSLQTRVADDLNDPHEFNE
jgi:glycosyltransferase involved in cell wall biosynthesis